MNPASRAWQWLQHQAVLHFVRDRNKERQRAVELLFPQRARKRVSNSLELLEPRQMLTAELTYGSIGGGNPLDVANFDLTLKAINDGDLKLKIFATGTTTELGSVTLDDGGDVTVNIKRDNLGLGDTVLDVAGDTLRIDLDTFSLLNSFVAGNGGTLSLNFTGGKDLSILQDIGIPLTFGNDQVRVESTGTGGAPTAVGFGLSVQSTSDVVADAGTVNFSGALSLNSDSEVDVENSTISASTVTLAAGKPLNVTGDADSLDFLQLPSATISMIDSQLSAGTISAIATAQATVTINAANAFSGSLTFSEVLLLASAEITVDGTDLTANSGDLTVSAVSNVTTTLARKPKEDGDTSTDAGVAVAVVSSEAVVDVKDSSTLSAPAGTTAVTANNTVHSTTTADGTLGNSSSAGAMVAVTTLLGDTAVNVQNSAVSGANVNVQAISDRTVDTTAKAAFKGSTDGDNNQKSEKTLKDTSQDGNTTTGDTASTADGSVDFAATVAVTVVTGDTRATVNSSTITATGAIDIKSSAKHDIATIGDGGTVSDSAPGVGVGVAVGTHLFESKANVTGSSQLDAPGGITVESLLPASTFDVTAKSGASGGSSGLGAAGALALNITVADAYAQLDAGANVNADAGNNGASNLTIKAQSTTDSTAKAEAAAEGADSSAGVGASVAINIADNDTRAMVGAGGSLSNVGALSINAISDQGMVTEAKGGSQGGTAITPVAALAFATYDTEAKLESDGTDITQVSGNLSATATHVGDVKTTATGKAEGSDAAIGASLGLTVHTPTTLATTARSLTSSNGSISLTAQSTNKTETTGEASAKGGDDNGGGDTNQENSKNRSAGNDAGSARGASTGSGSGSTPQASTSDGGVDVAAAVAINVVNADTESSIGSSRLITAENGTVNLLAESNTDTKATASGEAVNDEADVGVGVGVALNYVDLDNQAFVGGSSTIDANGLSVTAQMRDLPAEATDTHTSEVKATSGAGAKDVGVAGSVAINLVDVDTQAQIRSGVTLMMDGSAIGVKAVSNTTNNADAAPEGKNVPEGDDAGVGAALGFQRIDTTTLAEIQSGGSMSGTASTLSVEATGTHTTKTNATHGAKGDSVAVGGAVAIALVTNETLARVENGGAYTGLTGNVKIEATHTSTTESNVKADVEAGSVGVGVGVAVNVINETVDAKAARSITTGGAVTIASHTTADSTALAHASASGADKDGKDGDASDDNDNADNDANKAVNNNPNKGSDRTVPDSSDSQKSGNDTAKSESGSGGDGVGVAAAVAVNAVTVNATAETTGGADIDAGGQVTIRADVDLDAKAQTDSTAVDLSNGDVNIGAAVSLNFVSLTQTATVGTGSTIAGNGITVAAETTGAERNDYSASAYAAAGNKSGTVAGSGTLSLNVVTYKVQARTNDGSTLDSDGGITVSAEHDMGLLSASASAGFTTGDVAFGGSVAMNLINIGDNASDPYDTGTFASIGNGATAGTGAQAHAQGQVKVNADTLVTTLQLDLPASINSAGVDDPDINLTSLAVAAGGTTGSAGIAGSVSINILNLNSHAFVDQDAEITGGSMLINAKDDIHITSVAGSVGVGADGAGVGAGLDLLVLDRNTRAYVGDDATATITGGGATIQAESDENLLAVVANVGIGNSAGVAGSAAVQVVNRVAEAGTRAYVDGSVTSDGNLRIDADGYFEDKLIAGAIGAASTAAVGVSNTTLVQTHTVEAYVGNGGVADSNIGTLTIEATSTEKLLGITATAGASGTAAVGGSVTVGVITQNTNAFVGRGGRADSALAANVHADADTTLTGVAGSVAASGSAAVGVGVDVATLSKTTRAFLDSGVTSDVGGDLHVVATNSEDITSVVAGFAASGGASVSANPSIHVLNITTLAHIGDDPETGPAPLGPGNVDVDGSIEITADDATEIDKVSAGAAAGVAGVGLAASVTTINKRTDAFIGTNANVTARGQGGGVTSPLGVITESTSAATPGTNPPEAQASATYDGDAGSVGASAEVGPPALDDDPMKDESTDGAAGSVEVSRTTGRGATVVNGIAISATNSDDLETYSLAAGGGSVGVAVSGAVNVLSTSTRAFVADDADVNQSLSGATADQSVRIGAGNDFHHVAVTAAAAGGFVGVAPAVDVTVTDSTIEARIGDDATVKANNDITVDANHAEDLVIVTVGLAGGAVGVGAGVSVASLTSHTDALIGDATVTAGDSVGVRANADSDFVLVDGAAGGGFVGGGAGVGVVLVTKDTHAAIQDNATVDATGSGDGLGGTMTGDMINGDAADGFVKATIPGVVVQATSSESLLHIAVAAGGGFVGISGAVAVTVMDSDTLAEIGNADINQNTVSGTQNVYVNAGNETRLQTIVGALAGGVAGVGGAVDVGVIRNDTGAKIRNGANVRAGNDVEVNSLAIKELDGFTASASGGLVGLGAAVSVWSVGTPIVQQYDGQNPAEDGGVTAQDDAGKQSSNAVDQSNDMWSNYGNSPGPDDPVNRSSSESQSAMSQALSGVNGSNRPTYDSGTGASSVGDAVESGATTAGTEAIIENGATVRAGASFLATGDLNVNAKADVEVDMLIGQFAAGFVGAGAAVGINSIHEAVTASAGGTLRADGAVRVNADLDSELNFTSVAGQGGLVGVGASVVVLDDTSAVYSEIAAGASVDDASTVQVNAITHRNIDSENTGVQVGGVAVGASFSDVTVGGAVTARVGANAQIGQTDIVGSLSVATDVNDFATIDTTALAGGAGAATANFGFATINPTVTAEIGSGADVRVSGEGTVDANSHMDADSTVLGVSVGGGALAASVATVTINPSITGALRSNAVFQSTGGSVRVRAAHNESGGFVATATTVAGSGGVISGSGSSSTVDHNAAVLASAESGSQLLAASDAEVRAFSGAKADTDAGSLGIGAATIGTSAASSTIGGSVAAQFDGSTMTAGTGYVRAYSDFAADTTTVATTGGVIGASVNTADALVNAPVTAHVGNGTLTLGGNLTVQADADARATADSGGIEVGEEDFPNISVLGSIGASDSDATLDSTVTAEVGTGNISANGTVLIKATHNEGNDQRATATSSASGGSLGVAVSGADSTAESKADVYAKAGGAGGSIHGGAGVVIEALGNNNAEAITDGLGIGGIAGIGLSDSNATTSGTTEARVLDGADSSSRTLITGGGLSIKATGQDRGRAVSTAAGGGIFTGDTGSSADAVLDPAVRAELGQFSKTDVYNTVLVQADAAAEADSRADGTQGSGGITIGASTSRSRIGGDNDADPAIVSATIDDGAEVDAWNVQVIARLNEQASLDAAPGGNGVSKANASSSGGGAFAGSGASAVTTVRTNIDANVGANADIDAGNVIQVIASSRARGGGDADSFQGGIGAFGDATGQLFTHQNIDATIGSGATLVSGGAIQLSAGESTNVNSYAGSAGGGAIASGTATARGDINSSSAVTIGNGANITAETDLSATAWQFFEAVDGGNAGLFAESESYGAGVGANSYLYFNVNAAIPFQPTTSVIIGDGAQVHAKDNMHLEANVDGGRIESRGTADTGAFISDTDVEANTNLNTYAQVTVNSNALVTGEDLLDIRSVHERVVLDNGNEGNDGLSAFGVGGADSDADSYFNPNQRSYITGATDATVASRDLQVRVINEEPGWGFYLYAFGLIPDVSADGTWTADRRISWDSDVILLSGPVPELIVDSNGYISKAVNVSVTDGGVVKGEGDTIVNSEFTVNDIFNNDPGTALFEANSIGNPFADDDIWDDYDVNFTSAVGGNDGTWYARRTFDTVTLINHSDKKMNISNIDPIDRDGDPDGEVFINLNSLSLSGVPFNFNIINQFDPTLITIDSTSFASNADIQFNGTVDNPIGHTAVTSNSDILGDGSQLIRTNTATLTAAGNIGTFAAPLFGIDRNGLRIDLVQSAGRPENLDATAGLNIVLDLRGVRRDTGGGLFQVDIGTIDAGANVDIFMPEAVKEVVPASGGSYALIIDENLNGGVDNNGIINTPDPTPYIQFFKPDTGSDPYYDGSVPPDAVPLGVFGGGAVGIDATYDYDLVQAGRTVNGADIFLNGQLNAHDVNITANTNIYGNGAGVLYVLTNGDISLEETTGDMRLGRIKSTLGDVTLIADVDGPYDIIDEEDDDHLSTGNDATAEADVTGRNITFFALNGYIGEPCFALLAILVDFLEIDSSFSGLGAVNATAKQDIYLDEIAGDMRLGLIKSEDADVNLHTRAGAITDANAGANNIEAHSVDLVTVGGGVGSSGNDVEIDTDAATGGATDGRLLVISTANGAGDAGIYITETDEALDVLRAVTDKGDIRLTVPDEADPGENLVLLANGETLECGFFAEGRIQAQSDVELRVGDNVELTSMTTNFIIAGDFIDIRGDYGNADPGVGTTMNLRGTITPGAQVGERTRIFGHTDNDTFNYLQTKLGGDTYNYGSQNASAILANDGTDSFYVDRLQTLDTTRGTYTDSVGNVLPVRDALTLDGQADSDTYLTITHGSLGGNGGLGGISDYLINAVDTGASDDGIDTLEIRGSNDADVFLLRGQSYLPGHDDGLNSPEDSPATAPVLSPAFVALLHGTLDEIHTLQGDPAAQAANPTSPYLKVERINYDEAMNARLMVYGYSGDDYFASDDNAVITTLDGGEGADRFQIGQLYRSEREWDNVADPDDFASGTVLTTRGYLSRGISAPMTIYGGTGGDSFSVYSNKAELRLEGNEGNDEFIIRAFALESGEGGDGQTLVDGGEGDDNIQYNINAPVSIDGGPGFDRVVILGTEFADNFVITEDAIYGAGLKVVLAGNEELREIDGLEGDDKFTVLGTPADVATRIIGGLGSDTVNAMGDVIGRVVSRDLEGISSTVEHVVTADPNLDPIYDGMLAPGVDLNIATANSGQIVVEEPDGRTVVSESPLLGSTTDSYNIYLAKAPTAPVYVTVSAVLSPQQEQDGFPAGDTFEISINGGVSWARAAVLVYTALDFAVPRQVMVRAVNDARPEGPRTAVISHSSISADPNFNHVAIRNVEADIIDDDKPDILVQESFAEYDNGTQVMEGASPQGFTDTYSVRLGTAPIGNTVVQLQWDTTEISLSTADPRYDALTKTITYSAANWFSPVTFTITAVDDPTRENREMVKVLHSILSSADTRYDDGNPATVQVAPAKLNVSVIDNDAPGVLVTESFGSTLVVQDDPNTPGDQSQSDTYTVRLMQVPNGNVTITAIPLQRLDVNGDLVDTVQVLGSPMVFTPANWYVPQEVTLTEVPGGFTPLPGTEYDKYFSKRPHTLSELFGPLETIGGVGPEDRSLVEPILLPGETNALTSDGNVVSYSGSFIPGAIDTMVVETQDLLDKINESGTDDLENLADLVGRTLEISKAPGLDRFWLITAVLDLGNGNTQLTLQNPGRLEERWNLNGPPTSASEYAITHLSLNFFVDENTQIDKVNAFNDTSVADDIGTLIATNLSGLGMGPGVSFDTNEDNIPDLSFASGITYGYYSDSDPQKAGWYKDVEVLEVMLGIGNDYLTVNSTLQTTANHGGLTVLHGGGNLPVGGVMGGDTFLVNARDGGAPLVVFGETSADGFRYSGQSGVKSPNAMNFDYAGRDVLDARPSSESVVLYGGGNNDLIMGSQAGDHLLGGSGDDRIFGQQGNDHIYGDSGVNIDVNSRKMVSSMSGPPDEGIDGYSEAALDDLTTTAVSLARPTWADSLDGGSDLIFGEQGNDIAFGDHGIISQFWATGIPQDVRVVGTGTGLFGTANERLIESRSNTNGQGDTIFGNEGEDVLIGGAAGDRIDGNQAKDIIFGDNVSLDRTGHVGDPTNPRFRVLSGTQIYSTDALTAGNSQVTSAWQVSPDGTPVWTDYRVQLLGHSLADQNAGLNNFGNDYIAGGEDNDQIFGELGNDTVQGDGSIGTFAGAPENRTVNPTAYTASRNDPTSLLSVTPSVEAITDGDDYIEGNGGNDVVFGNLGQDDIVGGTSTMFGEITPDQRPDGADLIFGGAGTDIARNDAGDATIGADGTITANANGHSRDADSIIADNGDIHRLVGVNGAVGGTTDVATSAGYLAFNYDVNRPGEPASTLRIVPRATTLVDYTPGGLDYSAAAANDIGGNDEVHGESGDDFVYGMTGDDMLFGEGQDDDIVGGWGNDWISGGTGQDGILGDDGRLFTSRNSSIYGEPLNGAAKLLATDPDTKFSNGNVLNEFVYTPGSVQTATINVADQLKKSADLTPFSTQPNWTPAADEFGGTSTHRNDDILFGGLGGDTIHGESGDDAISGAEALSQAFTQIEDGSFELIGTAPSDYFHPYNPSDALRFNPVDVDAQHPNRTRAGEFALYDEYDPLRKILLNADGTLYKGTAAGALEFFLNFDETEGVALPGGTVPKGPTYPAVNSDGDDKLFGDLGNDWMVGGTGRDNVYGGFGNDLLNIDDDHDSTALTADPFANNVTDTHPSYEDRAYGGAGRDVLIANTGGDREIDWVGEFNSYLVPFAPFGTATVSRTLQPQLPEFLYAVSRADGADPTRAADTGADPLRNGEPEGELGLVLQKDAAWHDQTGAPADPQAGNIPGGKRDVLRSANFNDGQAQGFLADSGTWSVSSGRYVVAPTTLGGDAVSVFYVDNYIPNYFEMSATINAVKPTGGYNANAYLIFDYQSPNDFKFAGINVSTNKLEMGHRTAAGWIVDKQGAVPGSVSAGKDYSVFLSLNGSSALVTINNQTTLSYAFAPRLDADGYPHGLNEGMVGIGAQNARGQIDNVTVQRVAPTMTLDQTVDFSTGPTSLFQAPTSGTWTTSAGRYIGTPTASAPAIDLLALRVGPLALVESSTVLRTTGQGGYVFDYYGPDDFKFAILSIEAQQVLLGHRTARSGWVIDASYKNTTLNSTTDYRLGITLKGTTASVTLNGSLAASFIYNGVVTDGSLGLIGRTGQSSFDTFNVKTDDSTYVGGGSPLLAAEPYAGTPSTTVLSADALAPIRNEAIRRWSRVASATQLQTLKDAQFVITNLPDSTLGLTSGNLISIDENAAGYGWFVDRTPKQDNEFASGHGNRRVGQRMDLLSVVMHELGHVLGFEDHTGSDVMDETLAAGERQTRIPGSPVNEHRRHRRPAAHNQSKIAAAVFSRSSIAQKGQGLFGRTLSGTSDVLSKPDGKVFAAQ